jgi:hypothetical protein
LAIIVGNTIDIDLQFDLRLGNLFCFACGWEKGFGVKMREDLIQSFVEKVRRQKEFKGFCPIELKNPRNF